MDRKNSQKSFFSLSQQLSLLPDPPPDVVGSSAGAVVGSEVGSVGGSGLALITNAAPLKVMA